MRLVGLTRVHELLELFDIKHLTEALSGLLILNRPISSLYNYVDDEFRNSEEWKNIPDNEALDRILNLWRKNTE